MSVVPLEERELIIIPFESEKFFTHDQTASGGAVILGKSLPAAKAIALGKRVDVLERTVLANDTSENLLIPGGSRAALVTVTKTDITKHANLVYRSNPGRSGYSGGGTIVMPVGTDSFTIAFWTNHFLTAHIVGNYSDQDIDFSIVRYDGSRGKAILEGGSLEFTQYV